MSSELDYQKQIIDDAKKLSKLTYAIKLNNRFIAGVPDLMVKVPGYPLVFVEVKKFVMGSSDQIEVTTTPLQRATMKAMLASGLRCEVWVVVEQEGKMPAIVRVHPKVEAFKWGDFPAAVRKKGHRWPMREFLAKPVAY